MKSILGILLVALMLPMAACERQQGPAEQAGEKIDDALDQRPAEGARDAMEDAGAAVEDAAKDAKAAMENATEDAPQ